MKFNRIMQLGVGASSFPAVFRSVLFPPSGASNVPAFSSVLILCVFLDLCSWTLDFLPHFLDFVCVTDSPDFLVWTLACLYLV